MRFEGKNFRCKTIDAFSLKKDLNPQQLNIVKQNGRLWADFALSLPFCYEKNSQSFKGCFVYCHKVFNTNLLDLPILLVSLKTEKPIGSAFLFFKRGGDPNVAETVLTDEKINLTGGM